MSICSGVDLADNATKKFIINFRKTFCSFFRPVSVKGSSIIFEKRQKVLYKWPQKKTETIVKTWNK